MIACLNTNYILIVCKIANVGKSPSKSKMITVDDGFVCPTLVDRSNMIEDTSGDTFSITQIGSNVTVTRTDAPWPWGMNLKFKCCKGEIILYIYYNSKLIRYQVFVIWI